MPWSWVPDSILTGAVSKETRIGANDFRSFLLRFTPEVMEKDRALVDLLKRIAAQKKATPAQLALAWRVAQKPRIVPIAGTAPLHRLEEKNLGAANIERAAAAIKVEGEHYPAHLMASTGC